jgi:molecular chaperone DnaK
MLKDVGDKATGEERAKVEEGIADLKKVIETNDYEGMKTKAEELTNSLHAISAKIYQQPGGAEGPDGMYQQEPPSDDGGASGGDIRDDDETVVDADFEVKDDQ